uniref:Uncharacterized protein n=1 Tax=viral metagenome TaxID=1070528 RepID=A0A6C0JL07_9ZZZZ
MFPEKVLRIIREFSRSITRPDWRTCKKMTQTEYELLLTNSIMNKAIRNMFNNYHHINSCNTFTIQSGQSFYYKRNKYTIIMKVPPYGVIVYDSNGKKYIGELTINYKQCLLKNELHRMEGVYIKNLNKPIYLTHNTYITKNNIL